MTRSPRFIYFLLVIILLIVYGNSLNHQFVWDDLVLIVDNPLLQELRNIPRFFLLEDKFQVATGYYRPLAYASFAIDHKLWGMNPVGFTITNIVLHIASTLIFYRIAATISRSEKVGLIAALLFSLHPVVVETVNFHAGGRNTLLCATFGLLALLLHMRGKPFPATIFLAMALFSKEFGMLLPMVFFLYDYQVQQRKIRPWIFALYLVPVTVYLILRSFALSNANILTSLYLSEELLVTPYLVARYLLNMLLPFQLKVIYNTQTHLSVAVLCLLGLAALVGTLFVYGRKSPLFLPACWFFLFLLPVINIIPLNSPLLMADRYAYFSLMGFSLALSTLICRLKERHVIPATVLLCVMYAVITVKTNGVWKDEVSLYGKMMNDDPQSYFGSQNLGTYYYGKGDPGSAAKYLAMASSTADLPSTYLVGNASVLWEAGSPNLAEKILLRSIETERSNPEPYLMLEKLYRQKGDESNALFYRDQASALFPNLDQMKIRIAEDYSRSAEQFLREGRYVLAENTLWRARVVDPGSALAYVVSGRVAAKKGEMNTALDHLQKAAELDQLDPVVHLELFTVYSSLGRMSEAAEEMAKYREREEHRREAKGRRDVR